MRGIYRKYLKVVGFVGDIQSVIIFSLLYFLLVAPIGLIAGFLGDFLSLKSYPRWTKVDESNFDLQQMRKQ